MYSRYYDKATYSGRLRISLCRSGTLLFSELINIVSILYDIDIEFIILPYNFPNNFCYLTQ